MSNGESDKTGPDESSGTVEQPGQPSNAVDTQVQSVTSQPSDDFTSVDESLVDTGQNHSTPTSRICLESTSTPSVFSPTPIRYFNPNQTLTFPSQVIDEDNDSQTFPYVCYAADSHLCQNSYAVLISGRDMYNINFEVTCQNDVSAMQNILRGSYGTIPVNNIYKITPNENYTEREIEHIYTNIAMNKPRRLFWYYSGHALRVRNASKEIIVSDRQGDALTVFRIQAFIGSLMPDCKNVMVILDCCSAGEVDNLLLPTLSRDFMPERVHIQWCSCMAGGVSRFYNRYHSEFSYHIFSALTCAPQCPNLDANCPLCCKFIRAFRQSCQTGRFDWKDLMEYVHSHIDHRRYNFPPTDLPVFMMNPESRNVN